MTGQDSNLFTIEWRSLAKKRRKGQEKLQQILDSIQKHPVTNLCNAKKRDRPSHGALQRADAAMQ
jgi:hypothetical protein